MEMVLSVCLFFVLFFVFVFVLTSNFYFNQCHIHASLSFSLVIFLIMRSFKSGNRNSVDVVFDIIVFTTSFDSSRQTFLSFCLHCVYFVLYSFLCNYEWCFFY